MTGTYTHGHAESVLRSHRWRTAANSAAYLLPHLGEGDELLDVGCGPGTITCDLARFVPQGRVLGIDASADVIAAAARDGAAAGSAAGLEVGDAYGAARHGTFDIVHAHQVLQHPTGPVSAVGAWRGAVTRGNYWVMDWCNWTRAARKPVGNPSAACTPAPEIRSHALSDRYWTIQS